MREEQNKKVQIANNDEKNDKPKTISRSMSHGNDHKP